MLVFFSAGALSEPACSASSITSAKDVPDDEDSSISSSGANNVQSDSRASVMATVTPTIHSATASPAKRG